MRERKTACIKYTYRFGHPYEEQEGVKQDVGTWMTSQAHLGIYWNHPELPEAVQYLFLEYYYCYMRVGVMMMRGEQMARNELPTTLLYLMMMSSRP